MATGYAPYKVIDDDGSSHFASQLIEYKSAQESWKESHPDECWIIDVISDSLVYVNSSIPSLYPVKRFKTQANAEKWLVVQGADYLTRSDYEWLKAKKASMK